MQPCLVFRRDGLVAGFGSERDQESIEFAHRIFLIHYVAIGHLVVHVAQVATTFYWVSQCEPSLLLFLHLLPALSEIPLVSER